MLESVIRMKVKICNFGEKVYYKITVKLKLNVDSNHKSCFSPLHQ